MRILRRLVVLIRFHRPIEKVSVLKPSTVGVRVQLIRGSMSVTTELATYSDY